MNTTEIRENFAKNVVPSYSRFDVVLDRGEGSYVWDKEGNRYLDLGGGIAVCALGHAHPEIADALFAQASRLTHVSNLYYNEPQGLLAEALVKLIAPGRVFFCNSGAEANEGLFKLARKFGHDRGRYEVITALGSFHGRTLAAIAATGQEKVKKGFEPAVDGFKHVPFNDLAAMRAAITEKTAAILVEPIQGESGITLATAEYLRGLRALCDEHDLLLLFDEVQAGHFRTGKFHAWMSIVASASSRWESTSEDAEQGTGVHRQDAEQGKGVHRQDAEQGKGVHRQDADAAFLFRGMDRHAEVDVRAGASLPHWTQEHVTYAVTFRLADSLPASVLEELEKERLAMVRRGAPEPDATASTEDEMTQRWLRPQKIEAHLNAGHGACWLRRDEIAALVRDALQHFDGERYSLAAWCIMPNHVHVIVQPKSGHDLSSILHSWKSFTASRANELLARSGEFWQAESFDHLIRDERDLGNQVNYLWRNPEAAGLKHWHWRGVAHSLGFQPMGDRQEFEQGEGVHRQDADATSFLPDAIAMAKSLGNGFPIGAFWVREKYAALLSPGTHATTFGGTPLGCAVALKVLEIIQRDQLAKNASELGAWLKEQLAELRQKFPSVLREVRGVGLMLGLEFDANAPGFRGNEATPAMQVVERLHAAGLLAIPAGTNVIRLLPALNLRRAEAEEALRVIASVVSALAND